MAAGAGLPRLRAIFRIKWPEGHPEGPPRLDQAEQYFDQSHAKHAKGEKIIWNLKEHLDQRIVAKLEKWLRIKTYFREGQDSPPPARPKKLPEMHRLDELRGMTLTKPREAIESCVTRPGLFLLTAPSRSGKTVLGVQIAMCQARGIPLFEEYKTIQSPP
jgi:hypothetical protein